MHSVKKCFNFYAKSNRKRSFFMKYCERGVYDGSPILNLNTPEIHEKPDRDVHGA